MLSLFFHLIYSHFNSFQNASSSHTKDLRCVFHLSCIYFLAVYIAIWMHPSRTSHYTHHFMTGTHIYTYIRKKSALISF